tara:strand:- start:773 stop:1642 length:870 start_codon:yes stop_codon:yes gene_type:complete
MEKKLKKIAQDTNKFLINFLQTQRKTDLIKPMKYGLLPGGKKIRSKIIYDVSKIFNINYKTIIQIGAAVECIHAYSLIHDDLPCMDNDNFRRGKLATHKMYGESTAILAGNSLLTIAFEILSSEKFNVDNKLKINLVNLISKCAGHQGIAGGQFSDLYFEKKKIPIKKILEMQIKKTGKLFSFCCMAPVVLSKNTKYIKKFEKIGSDIGLLFQIADDLIDQNSNLKKAGKKTKKDSKKGKATLISLLGQKNAIKYANDIKLNIFKKLNRFNSKTKDLKGTIKFILERSI